MSRTMFGVEFWCGSVPARAEHDFVRREFETCWRPSEARRSRGPLGLLGEIDYSAFVIEYAFVGHVCQYGAPIVNRPVADLFDALRYQDDVKHDGDKRAVPFDVLQPGLDLAIRVRNVSDRDLPFAIILAGEVVR